MIKKNRIKRFIFLFCFSPTAWYFAERSPDQSLFAVPFSILDVYFAERVVSLLFCFKLNRVKILLEDGFFSLGIIICSSVALSVSSLFHKISRWWRSDRSSLMRRSWSIALLEIDLPLSTALVLNLARSTRK